MKTGKALFPNFTHDQSSPYWMQSLAYDHDRSHPKYQEFMMNAGMCMGTCPASETDLFRAQFQAKADWYQKNKGGTGNGGDGSGNGGDGSGNGGDGSVKPPSGKYPFKADGPCVEACTMKTGKAIFPNFTHDQSSPYWMQSLAYDHDRSHPKYQEFMMNAGMCMGTCPASETDLFRAQFQAKTEWYQKNKGNTGNGGDGSGNGGDGSGNGGDGSGNGGDGSVKPPSGNYPFKPDGPCVESCTMKTGKTMLPNFTHDQSSPYWMQSLAYDHDRSHPKYQEFMMNAGMCMSACPASETDLFRAQFQAKTDWYQKNKGNTGNGGDGSGNGGNGSGNGGDGSGNGANGGDGSGNGGNSCNIDAASYSFKPDGACVEACTMTTGKAMFPNFTHDKTSPYWMESLGYDHDRSHPKYQEFMMNAGMCMGACPTEEADLFRAQFQAKTEWYQKAKTGGGNCGNGGDGSTGGSGGDGSNGGAGGLPATTGTLGNTISAAGATATSTGSAVVSPTGAPQNSASAVASGILSIAAALLSTVALL
ncbi:hypothetical protein BGX28_000866 [Mortierella sp. GBA30]|nr:hypothetical protein BGX28_000866 [Mortierella sp. GBA30]